MDSHGPYGHQGGGMSKFGTEEELLTAVQELMA